MVASEAGWGGEGGEGGGRAKGAGGGEKVMHILARGTVLEGGRRGLREEKEDGGEAEYPVETGHTIGIPVYRCVGVRRLH